MSYELILRPHAEIDLASHFIYLSERNPAAALRFDKAVTTALERIEADPEIGARLNHPSTQHLGLRFYRPKGFRSYLIIFRVHGDKVFVSRILHGAQDIDPQSIDG